jgi:hypothetical protein
MVNTIDLSDPSGADGGDDNDCLSQQFDGLGRAAEWPDRGGHRVGPVGPLLVDTPPWQIYYRLPTGESRP